MGAIKDSIELTDDKNKVILKVSINASNEMTKLKWKPKPPYSKSLIEAIRQHIDPWIAGQIKYIGYGHY